MPRVKRGTTHNARRKRLLKAAKGFKWGRKSKIKLAKTAVVKAGVYAYRDRKVKKREKRALWQIQINAASRENDLSYSQLINKLKKNEVALDRKILAELARTKPAVFNKIVASVKE